MKKLKLAALLVCFASVEIFAQSEYSEGPVAKAIDKAGLASSVLEIKQSEFPELVEVRRKGGQITYISKDGKFYFQGSLIAEGPEGLIDLTAKDRMASRAAELDSLPAEEYISYPAKDMKSFITVFTDTECPFCRKFHSEIDELNEAGVGVRYLPFPRSGLKSEGAEKLTSLWCSDDRRKSLDEALRGKRVKSVQCSARSVSAGYELGRAMGIEGTPTLITPSGEMVTGYKSSGEVLSLLGLSR